MRLAAAEGCLQADDGIAAIAVEALQRARQNPLQAFGQKGDAVKVLRRRIILARVTGVDREKIGGELSFLETIGENVGMRQRDFDPRLQ